MPELAKADQDPSIGFISSIGNRLYKARAAVALIGTLALAGCGPADEPAPSSSPTSVETSAPPEVHLSCEEFAATIKYPEPGSPEWNELAAKVQVPIVEGQAPQAVLEAEAQRSLDFAGAAIPYLPTDMETVVDCYNKVVEAAGTQNTIDVPAEAQALNAILGLDKIAPIYTGSLYRDSDATAETRSHDTQIMNEIAWRVILNRIERGKVTDTTGVLTIQEMIVDDPPQSTISGAWNYNYQFGFVGFDSYRAAVLEPSADGTHWERVGLRTTPAPDAWGEQE